MEGARWLLKWHFKSATYQTSGETIIWLLILVLTFQERPGMLCGVPRNKNLLDSVAFMAEFDKRVALRDAYPFKSVP